MDKEKRIYFHKEDVWTQGDHWMSSASREIFEHFYKSIKATFLNQFKRDEIKELIEKNQNLRNWQMTIFCAYADAAERKSAEVGLDKYEEKRILLPEEIEFTGQEVVPREQMTFDKIIYPDFESFFINADHSFRKTSEGKKSCFKLYKNFIKDFTAEDLKRQIQSELKEAMNWKIMLNDILNDYINEKSNEKWHKFLSTNLDRYK